MSAQFITPAECPVCGEEVPRGAKACPGCGADERSGWNDDDAIYDGLDLPGHAYDDEEPSQSGAASHWLRNLVIMAMIGVLILFFVLR